MEGVIRFMIEDESTYISITMNGKDSKRYRIVRDAMGGEVLMCGKEVIYDVDCSDEEATSTCIGNALTHYFKSNKVN